MNQQLDMEFCFHAPYTLRTELDGVIKESHMRSLLHIEKICVRNLKTAHVKVAGFHFKTEAIRLLIIFSWRVSASRSTKILLLFEAAPSRVDDHKAFQHSFRDDTQFRKNRFVSVLRIFEHVLNSNEVIAGDDAFMLAVVVTNRTFATVLYGFMGEDVLRKRFSGIDIPAIAFIPQRRSYSCR